MDDIAALEKDSEAVNILQAKRAKSDRSFGRGSPFSPSLVPMIENV